MIAYIRTIGCCSALIIICLFAYAQVNDFGLAIADDQGFIDYTARYAHNGRSLLVNAFTKDHSNAYYYKPMTMLSFLGTAATFSDDIGTHHIASLFFHILGVLSVFAVLASATGGVWRSFFVAAIFGVHPFNVEAVALLATRSTPLSTIFCMLSLAAYVSYSRSAQTYKYLLCVILYVMGVLSKPNAAYFFIVFILMDYWPLQRLSPTPECHPGSTAKILQQKSIPRLLAEKIPFLLIFLAYGMISSFAHPIIEYGAGNHPIQLLTTRILNLPVLLCNFVFRFFCPFVYHHVITNNALLPGWEIAVCTLCLIVITVIALALRQTHRYFITGWLWFLGLLSPAIILRMNDIIDRYAYVPAIGLSIMCVWGARNLTKKSQIQTGIISLLAVSIVASLMIYCRAYVKNWKDFTAIDKAIRKNNIVLDQITLYAFVRFLYQDGRYAEALSYYRKMIEQAPESPHTNYKAGLLALADQNYPDAISYFKKVIRLKPDFAPAHIGLAEGAKHTGQTEDAITHYQAALNINPRLSQVHNDVALLLFQKGEVKMAISHLQKAIEIDPEYQAAQHNLKWILETVQAKQTEGRAKLLSEQQPLRSP